MSVSEHVNRTDVVGGLFKVRGETAHNVIQYVTQWVEGDDADPRFERLEVRDCTGKKERDFTVAIEFLYRLTDEGLPDHEVEELHNQFFAKYTDLLRRRFGNGLAVWDISTPVYVVKQIHTPGYLVTY